MLWLAQIREQSSEVSCSHMVHIITSALRWPKGFQMSVARWKYTACFSEVPVPAVSHEIHFSWSILPKYHNATALCIYKLYNTFLRCSTKLHIKHIHKHYTYKTPNPTAIMSSYVPTPPFFLILYSYHQHHTVSGTVQVHDIKGCL